MPLSSPLHPCWSLDSSASTTLDALYDLFCRALPAFTIHTAVAQAKKAFAKTSNPRIRAWGPTLTGLAIVPVLPYLFDHPVEHVTDTVFDWIKQKLIDQKNKSNDKGD